MDHVAIMRKSWGLLPKILSGEKTIESRWYMARYAPWNRIEKGDIVYFKNSGEPVTVKAEVSKVMQFVLRHTELVSGSKNIEYRSFDFTTFSSHECGSAQDDTKTENSTVKQILKRFAKADGIEKEDIPKYYQLFKDKKYCILVFLSDPQKVKPFEIDKSGFGAMCAWIIVEDINTIKLPKV